MRRGLLYVLVMMSTSPVFADVVSYTTYAATGSCSHSTSFEGVTVTCSANNGYGFSGFASAQSDPGNLHVEAIADYTGVPTVAGDNTFGGQSAGDAELMDTLYLTGAPASGFLQVNVHLDGSLTISGTGVALNPNYNDALTYLIINYGAALISLSGDNGLISQDATEYIPYSNDSVQIDVQLDAGVGCWFGSGAPALATCSASALFSDTGTITGIGILDSDKEAVSGATFTSASGYEYPSAALVPTPEPSQLLSLTVGLLGLVVFRHFRHINLKRN
jgi:hypothetical protein